MLWTNEQLNEEIEERFAADMCEEVYFFARMIRSDYEAHIAELEQIADDRLRVMYEYGERIAELEAKLAQTLEEMAFAAERMTWK